MDTVPDRDPQETREWLDALDGVLAAEGPDRAHFLIEQLIDKARRSGAYLPFSANTAYINTIPVEKQPTLPGDFTIEHNGIRRHLVEGFRQSRKSMREALVVSRPHVDLRAILHHDSAHAVEF